MSVDTLVGLGLVLIVVAFVVGAVAMRRQPLPAAATAVRATVRAMVRATVRGTANTESEPDPTMDAV